MRQYYFAVTWDEDNGWRIDEQMSNNIFEGVFYDHAKQEWSGNYDQHAVMVETWLEEQLSK